MNAARAPIPKVRKITFEQIVNDFRGMDPNDPGLWPLIPRIVVLAALFAILVACAAWFDWSSQLDTLDQHRAEESKLRDEWKAKKSQAINLAEYQKQLADIDRQFGALLKQLPNRTEMESLLIDVNQAGRGHGLQFVLWRPGSEAIREFYAELPIAIKVTGDYDDIGNFAADIAQLNRIVTLRDITITTPDKASGLVMEANAVTYRYLDEEEVAKQRREKAAEKKK